MSIPDSQPPSAPTPRSSSLVPLVAAIVVVFIGLAIVAGLLGRQTAQESARLGERIDTLQSDVDALRGQVQALTADAERTAVLSFTDAGYFPVRTNAGTLLLAVADVEPADKGVRVHLRIGNPQAMRYLGYTIGFAWDKGKGQQAFRVPLEPGTWTVVPLTIAPADLGSTKALRITSVTVDEIPAR